jgi:signal transduction histidine kinase
MVLLGADHVAQALSIAQKVTPDLILVRAGPNRSGFDICRDLHANRRLAGVPIIMILDDDGPGPALWLQRTDDFIIRPLKPLELQARVQVALHRSRQRRQAQTHPPFMAQFMHELRTPLATMTLISDNLRNCRSQKQRQKLLKALQTELAQLQELISMASRLVQMDGPGQRYEPEVVDLALLVRQEVERLLLLAAKKQQTLRWVGDEPVTVWGNAGQLRGLVRNLVHNAIQYTPSGGQICCECRRGQRADLGRDWPGTGQLPQNQEGWAALRVTDTGLGISREDRPYIFDYFYRGRLSGAEPAPGSGLGLAIVREVLEGHAGYTGLNSVPGQGTTFAVYLPLVT